MQDMQLTASSATASIIFDAPASCCNQYLENSLDKACEAGNGAPVMHVYNLNLIVG